MADYTNRDIESSIFHHLVLSPAMAPRAFGELSPDNFWHNDYRDGFIRIAAAYTSGKNITIDAQCVDYLNKLGAESSIGLVASYTDALDAMKLQVLRRNMDSATLAIRSMIDDPTIGAEGLVTAFAHYQDKIESTDMLADVSCNGADLVKLHLSNAAQQSAGNDNSVPSGIHIVDKHLRMTPGNLT